MTLADYAARWLATRTGRLAPNASRAYASALTHHVLPALGAVFLCDLSTPMVRAWLVDEAAAKRPPNTIKSYLAALSTVLTDALIDGLVEHNAAHGASRRLLPGRTTVAPKAMTPHELDAFLVAARMLGSAWAGDLFLVYARTGLRLGEALALQARNILVAEVALRVEQTYHGGALAFGPPKSGQARLVECSPGTLRVLERRRDAAQTPRAFLFPGTRAVDWPLHPSTVEWAFDRAAGIAGLPTHYTVHSLRHTYASVLLAAGAPPQWVQQQLGHRHYAITVDLYGSWLRSRRPDLVALLDQDPHHHGLQRAERGRVLPFPMKTGR